MDRTAGFGRGGFAGRRLRLEFAVGAGAAASAPRSSGGGGRATPTCTVSAAGSLRDGGSYARTSGASCSASASEYAVFPGGAFRRRLLGVVPWRNRHDERLLGGRGRGPHHASFHR